MVGGCLLINHPLKKRVSLLSSWAGVPGCKNPVCQVCADIGAIADTQPQPLAPGEGGLFACRG